MQNLLPFSYAAPLRLRRLLPLSYQALLTLQHLLLHSPKICLGLENLSFRYPTRSSVLLVFTVDLSRSYLGRLLNPLNSLSSNRARCCNQGSVVDHEYEASGIHVRFNSIYEDAGDSVFCGTHDALKSLNSCRASAVVLNPRPRYCRGGNVVSRSNSFSPHGSILSSSHKLHSNLPLPRSRLNLIPNPNRHHPK